jgi:hypothetical protein
MVAIFELRQAGQRLGFRINAKGSPALIYQISLSLWGWTYLEHQCRRFCGALVQAGNDLALAPLNRYRLCSATMKTTLQKQIHLEQHSQPNGFFLGLSSPRIRTSPRFQLSIDAATL